MGTKITFLVVLLNLIAANASAQGQCGGAGDLCYGVSDCHINPPVPQGDPTQYCFSHTSDDPIDPHCVSYEAKLAEGLSNEEPIEYVRVTQQILSLRNYDRSITARIAVPTDSGVCTCTMEKIDSSLFYESDLSILAGQLFGQIQTLEFADGSLPSPYWRIGVNWSLGYEFLPLECNDVCVGHEYSALETFIRIYTLVRNSSLCRASCG